jgi:phosphoglycolate phosphatase
LAEAEIDRLLPRFLGHYGENVAERSAVFPGVVETLSSLGAANVRLAVCTNKPIGLTESLMAALGLDRHFEVMLGGDSLDVRKPDPRHLLETIHRLGLAAADAVMVGDSETDIKAARAAAVPVVAVDFGYTEIPIHDLGPDHVISHFDELIPVLTVLLGSPAPRP